MKHHSWEIETVDGGHLGSAECWKCGACGASGGAAFTMYVSDGFERQRPPRPFIPGPAIDLPGDCDKAKEVIADHARERLRHLSTLASKGLSPSYAKSILAILSLNEARAGIGPMTISLIRLLYEVESPYQRPSLEEVEERLRSFGFRLPEDAVKGQLK